jgi:hypothetical protein
MQFLSAALFTSLSVCPFVSGQKVATSLFLVVSLIVPLSRLCVPSGTVAFPVATQRGQATHP